MKSLEQIKSDNVETRYVGPPPGEREERPPSAQYMTLMDSMAKGLIELAVGEILIGTLSKGQYAAAYKMEDVERYIEQAYRIAGLVITERERWDHKTGEREDD